MVSGGDDSALYAAEFGLMLDDNDVTKVHVLREVSEASAHTSSVTGNRTMARILLTVTFDWLHCLESKYKIY